MNFELYTFTSIFQSLLCVSWLYISSTIVDVFILCAIVGSNSL